MSRKADKFIRKGAGGLRYTWTPIIEINKTIKDVPVEVICNASPGSQGVDANVQYVYKSSVGPNGTQHLAYVECDYVQ